MSHDTRVGSELVAVGGQSSLKQSREEMRKEAAWLPATLGYYLCAIVCGGAAALPKWS